MLKIFIGPNGYGKTYELERIKKSLFDENNDRKDVIAPQKTQELQQEKEELGK